MSHALYSTRLYWAPGRGGIAKLHGRLVQLEVAPELPGVRVEAIDYVPEIGIRTVQPYASARRDMTDDEVSVADAVLARLAAQANSGTTPE